MRIINFKTNDPPADALYHCHKILKITDYIKLLNCMLEKKCINYVLKCIKMYCLSDFEGTFK